MCCRCCRSASSTFRRIHGFKKKTVTGIVLEVNQEPRVDFVLEVGAVTETVNVSSQATLLQTENAVVGHVVDNRYTTQIPLNGRDFAQLVLLVPGTATRRRGFRSDRRLRYRQPRLRRGHRRSRQSE